MTTRPTVEGVSEERLREIDSGRVKSGHPLATENEIRRMTEECLAARQQLAEMRGRWIPFAPGDALPPRGAYLVCTKYNTGRPRDPIGRMETSRHTDDVSAWNDYTVAYWYVPLPPPYDAALAPTSQPSRGKCGGTGRLTDHIEGGGTVEYGCPGCVDCAQPERQGAVENDDRKLIVDALMMKHIHHADHAGKYGAQDGFQGHAPLAERCKALADSIMDGACPSPPPTNDIVAFLRDLNHYIYRDQNQMLDRAIAALGEKAIPLGTITDAVVHKMCHYLREDCAKCPVTVATPYGDGEPGCYGIAFETAQMARCFLYEAAQLPAPPVAGGK